MCIFIIYIYLSIYLSIVLSSNDRQKWDVNSSLSTTSPHSSLHWGSTWRMTTPLDNIQEGSFILIKICIQNIDGCKYSYIIYTYLIHIILITMYTSLYSKYV